MKNLLPAIILFLFFSPRAWSQASHEKMNELAARLDSVSELLYQTSVYISANKDIFIAGEDLWFNAFVLNARDFSLTHTDNTLYLRLQHTETDSTIWQEMYPIVNGIAAGHVYLPDTLAKGSYVLKAFTRNSFVAGQPYFYASCPIEIVNAASQIPAFKQPSSSPRTTDIQFNLFPEGGNLVAGFPNKVAFKAVNKAGNPVEVHGTLLKNNAPILSFISQYAGMGDFTFVPEKSADYRVRLQENDSVYTVPDIRETGITMTLLENSEDTLTFKLRGFTTSQNKRFYLRLQMRGTILSIAEGTATDSLKIKIPVSDTQQGIAEATLYDAELRPVATRLVYLHPQQQLNISLSLSKPDCQRKEKLMLKIKTTNPSGRPVPAALSVKATDKLFSNPHNAKDIVSYYYLATQLRGRIYDPAWYFDPSNKDSQSALDLLLLTQGWSRYTWNDENIRATVAQPGRLADSLESYILPVKKAGYKPAPLTLMLFNYNKKNMRVTVTDSSGKFYITPDDLAIGSRFFIKYLSEKEYSIQVSDPFRVINSTVRQKPPADIFYTKALPPQQREDVNFLQYGKTLKEVTVTGKGREYADPYLGYLDSIARYEGNTDYIGDCGWLNCPDGRTDIKPVEGKTYWQFSREVTSHHQRVVLTASNHKQVVYHYPKYTEEELLKKFKIVMEKGYYQSREFYQPAYDKDDRTMPDNRNTLLWKPLVVTDNNGEATIEFFTSDITGPFIGTVEGVADLGLLGTRQFNFSVTGNDP